MDKSRKRRNSQGSGLLCLAVAGAMASCFPFPRARAATYSGRASVGGYLSRERFSIESDGSRNNDFQTISSRLFTRFSDMGDDKLELAFDLRDKHDFFEKLDSERLALQGRNTLQLRQLSLYRGAPGATWTITGGRFPVADAGAVELQGIDTGLRWAEGVHSSVFAGWDTKLPFQTYVQTNPNAHAFGTYTTYHPFSPSWRKTLRLANAFVVKEVARHVDRMYLYDFLLWEWDSPSRLLGMVYLDFRPRTYVQTGLLSYTQKISEKWESRLQGSAIDTIEYSRRRSVLETLPSTPYKEGSLSLRQVASDNVSVEYGAIYGHRSADNRGMQEYSAGTSFHRIASSLVSGGVKLGHRKNFTSRDTFGKLSLGFYPQDFEINLEGTAMIQKEAAATYHPVIAEAALAYFFSRELYGTLSYQYAGSGIAKIHSFFLFVGYRFGSKDVPPLREGAPPRGRL